MTPPASHAPPSERLRYLSTFARHAAAATALRAAPRRGEAPASARLRALFISPHPPSHLGTVVRFTRWLSHLAQHGCDAEVVCASTEAEFDAYKRRDAGADTRYHRVALRNQVHNVRRAASADVVVLHRGLLPWSPWQRPTFERLLARVNPALVYDFYDPIWIERRGAAAVSRSRLGAWLHPPDKIEQIIRLARVVTVSNEPLAEFARRHNSRVHSLPMLLEPSDYEPRDHGERRPVVLGWSGSANNLARLRLIEPALRRVAATRDVLVRVVAPEAVEMPGVPVESLTHPWSPDSERQDLAGFDVGLLPLDPHSPNDGGKSPFKLLQYLAAGLPVVATPLAIETDVVRAGESFLPASTEDEWVEALTRIVDDAALRARMGEAARLTVENHYSFAVHAPAFVGLLREAARVDDRG